MRCDFYLIQIVKDKKKMKNVYHWSVDLTSNKFQQTTFQCSEEERRQAKKKRDQWALKIVVCSLIPNADPNLLSTHKQKNTRMPT